MSGHPVAVRAGRVARVLVLLVSPFVVALVAMLLFSGALLPRASAAADPDRVGLSFFIGLIVGVAVTLTTDTWLRTGKLDRRFGPALAGLVVVVACYSAIRFWQWNRGQPVAEAEKYFERAGVGESWT